MIKREKNESGAIVHRAKWVVADPWTIIQDGFVKAENGKISEIGRGMIPRGCPVKDYGHGTLMPAVINAHTHLELCALRGKVSCQNSFQAWVVNLLQEREKADPNTLIKSALNGIMTLKESGCVATGEISTLGLTRNVFFESKMCGIWFKEFLGDCKKEKKQTDPFYLAEESKAAVENAALSLAVHGPHTTGPELICEICKRAGKINRPYSLHLAESEDEVEFITTGKGPWADFLTSRNIKFSEWGVPARSPVSYLFKIGALNGNTLAVHLLRADDEDLKMLSRKGVRVCLCPRSNHNLFGILPDIKTMLDVGLTPCLGTDSLASVETLSIFDEMSFVRNVYPELSSTDILAMATIFGARVLGIESYVGSLFPGKKAAMVFLPVDGKKVGEVVDTVVYHNFDYLLPIL